MPDKTPSVRIAPDIYAKVKAIAKSEGRMIQSQIDRLLREAIEKLPKTKR